MVMHQMLGPSFGSSEDYEINRSLRFNSADSAYLNRTPLSAGNRKTWTWSGWVKRAKIPEGFENIIFGAGTSGTNNLGSLSFETDDQLRAMSYNGSYVYQKITTAVFRDPSAWYHIVYTVDTTDSTAEDRVKLYVNGVRITSFATNTNPAQNADVAHINSTSPHYINKYINLTNYGNLYLAEVHFVDGQALSASSFGEYDNDNNWIPKSFTHGTAKYTGDWIGDTVGSPYGGAVNGSDKAFDGNDSTGAAANTNSAFVFTPSTAITGISKVRIRAYRDANQSDDDGLQLNGTAIGSNWTAGAAVSEVEITVNNLTSLRWETDSSSNWYKVYKIEIYYDGAYHTLVPGDINSFHLDFADNSSKAALGKNGAVTDDFTSTVGALTTTQAADFYTVGSYPPNNLFDGSTSTIVYGGYNSVSTNSDLIWTPNGAYSASSSLRVYAGYYSTIYVNGVSKATGGQSSAQGWVTLSHTGSITSIKFENTSNANVVRAAAIEVDGTVVVTTAWTVNNLTAENPTTLPGVDFDGSGDHVESADHADYSLGTNDFTIEFYVFPREFVNYDALVMKYAGNASNSSWWMSTNSSGHILFYLYYGSSEMGITTSGTGMNLNKWNHVACVRDGSTARVYINGLQVGTGSISTNSVNDSATALRIGEDSTGAYDLNGIMSNVRLVNGTCLYPNGTKFTIPSTPLTNVTNTKLLCCQSSSSATAATVSPNTLTTSGDPFATQQSDSSPANDSLIDTPTNITADSGNNPGNYCTWNPLKQTSGTYTEGNLQIATSSGNKHYQATLGLTSGKWYFEVTPTSGSTPGMIGIALDSKSLSSNLNGDGAMSYYSVTGYKQGGNTSGVDTSYGATYTYGDVIGVALDLDSGTKTLTFYKNGVSQGVAFNPDPTLGSWHPAVSAGSSSNTTTFVANFGQRPFAYTLPTGYKSLCTTNLPDPTIADGSTAFDTITYTGSSSPQTVSGLNFASDFIWIKSRSHNAWHILQDSTRGFGKTLFSNDTNAEIGNANDLISNVSATGFSVNTTYNSGTDTATTTTSGSNNYVAWAWDAGANGNKTYSVKVVSDSGNKYRFDDFGSSAVTLELEEGSTYVFDQSDSSNAGHPLRFSTTSNGTHGGGTEYTTGVTTTGTPGQSGAKTTIVVAASAPTLYYYCSAHSGMGGQANTNSTAGSSNFDGSIQSLVRPNPSAGFSIVQYTGTASAGTIGHGLNAAPAFFVIKGKSNTYDWVVYHKELSASKYVYLNSSGASSSGIFFDGTAPTSSVFSISTAIGVNSNGVEHIVYCFSPVEGYSAFGKFSGNSSTDGPFQYCGFKPRFLLLKGITQARNWIILDTERDAGNVGDSYLHPDSSGAESTYAIADILSNGFKMRYNGGLANQTGEDYIWAAFASHPFKTSRAR